MKPVKALSYFDVVGNSQDPGVSCPEPTLAIQSSKDECDINVIINRYLKTGELPQMQQAAYMDLSEIPTYAEALQIVIKGEEAFAALPAQIRREFDNDPLNLVAFASDPANLPRARELGLAPPAPSQPSPSPGGAGSPANGNPATPPTEPPKGGGT